MTTDTSRRQERIDRAEERASPSAGWRTVYAAMGIAPDGGVETEASPNSRDNHTLDEYVDEASTRPSDRDRHVGRSTAPSD